VNSDSLDPGWVRAWAADVSAHLRSVLAAFDTYYPYPPGRDEIVLADAAEVPPGVPPDLATFYGVVHEVSMPDIGNGFFIHPAGNVFDDGNAGTVFASNGGGILYAIDGHNQVHRSNAASVDSGFEIVATCLREFLDQVRDAVTLFATTRTPGDL
jgi:hypothetical protein